MNTPVLNEFFSALVAISWRAAWLVGALVLLRLVVRGKIPAQVWYVAWIVVAVRLLLPFSVPASWSPYNWRAGRVPTATAAVASGDFLVARAAIDAPAAAVRPSTAANTAIDAVAPFSISKWTARFDPWAVIWLAGVLGLLGARLLAVWRFRRVLRHAMPAGPEVTALVAAEVKAAGLRSVRCLETTAVDAPALFGILRPRLLLPPGFSAALDEAELRLVIRHELAHCWRRDLLGQAAMQLALAVHWFNPFVWLAARLARTDCELACDEFVLRRAGQDTAMSYGGALLKVFGLVRDNRRRAPVLAIIEGKHQLTTRIRLIAAYRRTSPARAIAGIVFVAAVAAASITRESRAQAVAGDRGGKPEVEFRADQVSTSASGSIVGVGNAQVRCGDIEIHCRRFELNQDKTVVVCTGPVSGRKAGMTFEAGDVTLYARDQRLDAQQMRIVSAPAEATLHSTAWLADQNDLLAEKMKAVTDDLQQFLQGAKKQGDLAGAFQINAALQGLSDSARSTTGFLLDGDARKAAEARTALQAGLRSLQQLQRNQLELEKLDAALINEPRKALITAALTGAASYQQSVEQLLASPASGAQATQYEFHNVVVNLLGSQGTRYLKTSFVVTGRDLTLRQTFETMRPQLTDATLDVLSAISVKDVDAADFRSALREKLMAAYNNAIGRKIAEQVYFSDFIMQ
jgi:beta-lactamase regulating signal transducer with metallopeptidase domain/flagellar basal body-associated protein FliL